jgi:hypothetical protein
MELVHQNTKYRPTQEAQGRLSISVCASSIFDGKRWDWFRMSAFSLTQIIILNGRILFFQPKQMKDVAGYEETNI